MGKVVNKKWANRLGYVFITALVLFFGFIFLTFFSFLPPIQGFMAVVSGNPVYGEGVRTGQIIKYSDKGYLFKTHEGELLVTQTGNASLNQDSSWYFSIPKNKIYTEDVINKVNEAIDKGYVVKVHYKQMMFREFWNGDTAYFVDKIEFSKNLSSHNL